MNKVNLAEAFASIDQPWSPRIAGVVNDHEVKLAKLDGAFIWHHHEEADELFLVISGSMTIRLRDRDVDLTEGEFFIVPKGVEHLPVAPEEAHVLLFEPAGTLNTGNVVNERTVRTPRSL